MEASQNCCYMVSVEIPFKIYFNWVSSGFLYFTNPFSGLCSEKVLLCVFIIIIQVGRIRSISLMFWISVYSRPYWYYVLSCILKCKRIYRYISENTHACEFQYFHSSVILFHHERYGLASLPISSFILNSIG
jgi:hypothetical protein